MAPQIIFIILTALSFGIASKRIIDEDNDADAIHSMISIIITQSLLYWGGFYDVFGN